jgi:Alpha/beta hydrolase domain
MIPFARTAAERTATNDPRLSLEERYGSHEGYVAALIKGTERAVKEGFLLPIDATQLIEQARASKVLR